MFGNQALSGLVQVVGPAIVAHSFPAAEHLLLGPGGQSFDSWKSAEERLKVAQNGGDLGLLKHHLADPNGIGIAIVPPGQIPMVLVKPRKKPLLNHPSLGWRES